MGLRAFCALGALGHLGLGSFGARVRVGVRCECIGGDGHWRTRAGEAVGGHGREATERDDPHNGGEHPRDERRHVGEDVGVRQEGELADDRRQRVRDELPDEDRRDHDTERQRLGHHVEDVYDPHDDVHLLLAKLVDRRLVGLERYGPPYVGEVRRAEQQRRYDGEVLAAGDRVGDGLLALLPRDLKLGLIDVAVAVDVEARDDDEQLHALEPSEVDHLPRERLQQPLEKREENEDEAQVEGGQAKLKGVDQPPMDGQLGADEGEQLRPRGDRRLNHLTQRAHGLDLPRPEISLPLLWRVAGGARAAGAA